MAPPGGPWQYGDLPPEGHSALIRDAGPGDAGQLLRLIRELATYKRAPDAVQATEADLRRHLFSADTRVFALVAEVDEAMMGVAIYFVSFSTWTARPGLYLEDLFVEAAHRSGGIGRALMRALAARAVELGYKRLEWAVLDWNERATSFYRSLGADPLHDWTTFRLSGERLERLAGADPLLPAMGVDESGGPPPSQVSG
jgi:GNAT superfamily N-acetyltransferase